MTAKDELSMQSPDALLSGQTTVDLIQSCVPNIKNAWLIPTVDLDYILIAIRRATYGNAMDFTSVCPHCKKSNENTINLEILQNQIYNPNFEETLTFNELELYSNAYKCLIDLTLKWSKQISDINSKNIIIILGDHGHDFNSDNKSLLKY